jgi:holliday junction DNA helicase RuvB
MIISNQDNNRQSGDEVLEPINESTETKKLKTKIKTSEPSTIQKLEQEEDVIQLRPSRLDEVVGQANVVRQLKLILDSCQIRSVMPEHILFYGQPGLGKTTLANLIASEIGANFRVITAPSLQKVGDIVGILVGLEPRTVLFIDEIHRLKAPLEETLYSAMEDYKVDIVMGKGNGASTLTMDINPFVLVGATTQLGRLSKPLKDRFASIFQLETYSDLDMHKLIERSCSIIGLNLTETAIDLVCDRSRGVPRIANNLLKRLLDYQVVSGLNELKIAEVKNIFVDLGVYQRGLTKSDLTYLKALQDGSSLGLRTLASILQEDIDTVEQVIEPYLLHLGLIDKTISGRSLTTKGKSLLL